MRALVVVFALGAACNTACNQPRSAPLRTEIAWDTYGIPHIRATDEVALFRAFGWAQAASHGDQILHMYAEARGRSAALFGPWMLDADRHVLTLGIPARAAAWYAAQPAAFRADLDAFADGINAYAKAHPEAIEDAAERVLPVTGVDVVAHAQRVLLLIATGPASSPPPASAAWALGPKKAEGATSILLANPHLPWRGPLLFYEAQLTAPGIDLYGATLIGFPVVLIGFDDHHAWTHTVNTQDVSDLYAITKQGDGYRLGGKQRAYEAEVVDIEIAAEGGGVAHAPFTIKRTAQGPIVGEEEGKPLALRVAGLDQPFALEQWWQMARARTLAEFQAAITREQIAGLTTVYADADGNVLYFDGGVTPARRDGAPWEEAQGLLPGDDPGAIWTGTLPAARVPMVVNPPAGWIQHANGPPWWVTSPGGNPKASDYPSYVAPSSFRFPRDFRAQLGLRLLDAAGKLDVDGVIALKHTTELEVANRVLPELLAGARARKSAVATRAADVLAAWDHKTDATSKGAVLFERWAEAFRFWPTEVVWKTPFSSERPFATPTGLADPALAGQILEAIAQQMEQAGLPLDLAWGDVHRLRYDGVDLPGNGATDSLATLRVVVYGPPGEDGKALAAGGDSYTAVIAFGPGGAQARALLTYGNASQRGSAHRTDQLELFAKKQLRAVWRTRAEVDAHTERHDFP